jgi:hypothetical protein
MAQTTDDPRSPNIVSLFGQLFMIPLAAIVYSVDLLLRTMQGVQQVTNHSLDAMAGCTNSSGMGETRDTAEIATTGLKHSSGNTDHNTILNEEDKELLETNQNFCKPDQKDAKCLILWRYKVLFIKRDYEYAFPEAEDLITDDIGDITAWKIAEFIQQLGRRQVTVPQKWITKQYPKPTSQYWRVDSEDNSEPDADQIKEACKRNTPIYLIGLPDDDKRYLRLFAQQLASYSRQDPEYEERQISILEGIRSELSQIGLK